MDAKSEPKMRVVELTQELINRPSVTPDDAGCQDRIAHILSSLGFKIEKMNFGEVSNLWARRGTEGPLFCFAGHTDVVPAGDDSQWDSPAFSAEIRNGMIYGRGAADMKGSIAAMLCAYEEFLKQRPNHSGSFAFLLTSDEEGPAVNGTVKVMQTLHSRGETIDYCLVGEPSSSEKTGDVVRVGRRGSLNARIVVHGKGGHVAYPDLVDNPIHALAPALSLLSTEVWDPQPAPPFPPTSFQVSNILAGEGTTNVVPGEVIMLCNWRFSSALNPEDLSNRTEAIFSDLGIKAEFTWQLSGNPFLTDPGTLVTAVQESIQEVTHVATELSTGGGTSDGRFIAPYGTQVVELGPINATIHKDNESTSIQGLIELQNIYKGILERLLL